MINIQYFRTAQDIKDAYGDNVPSNVVCVAGNNDSVLINTSNNNPHSDKEEQDKPTIVNKINNQDITVDPAKNTLILNHNYGYTGLGTVTVNAVTSSIDSNITPENIKQGVSILGVEGTLREGSGGESNIFVVPNDMSFGYSIFNEIPSNLDFSNVTDMSNMFVGCSNITSIPQLNTSNVTDMSYMFNNCYNLTAIPQLDTSNVAHMQYMFHDCRNLTTIPQLNTSNVTDMNNMFSECHSITSIPELNTSNVTDMNNMFYNCNSLTTVSQLYTSNVTNMNNMFCNCNSLTTIPQLDTSNVTDMSSMFRECHSITSVPQLNTSNVTNMTDMFSECHSITSAPQLNTSNVINMNYMFNNCKNLATVPQLNTSNVTGMTEMFGNCENLTTVEGIDFSGLTSDLNNLFGWTLNMSKLTRFIVNGKINVSIADDYSIKALTAIDYDSVKSILAAANLTDNTNPKTLTFNRTMTDQNGELAALVTSCTSKGWTITGLTIV